MIEKHLSAIDAEAPVPPPMSDAWLDEESLNRLFDDLAATQVLTVRVKGDPRVQVSDATVSLDNARELLFGGTVRGVQVRYLFQTWEWCDTIMAAKGRYRLVRVQYPQTEPEVSV